MGKLTERQQKIIGALRKCIDRIESNPSDIHNNYTVIRKTLVEKKGITVLKDGCEEGLVESLININIIIDRSG